MLDFFVESVKLRDEFFRAVPTAALEIKGQGFVDHAEAAGWCHARNQSALRELHELLESGRYETAVLRCLPGFVARTSFLAVAQKLGREGKDRA